MSDSQKPEKIFLQEYIIKIECIEKKKLVAKCGNTYRMSRAFRTKQISDFIKRNYKSQWSIAEAQTVLKCIFKDCESLNAVEQITHL